MTFFDSSDFFQFSIDCSSTLQLRLQLSDRPFSMILHTDHTHIHSNVHTFTRCMHYTLKRRSTKTMTMNRGQCLSTSWSWSWFAWFKQSNMINIFSPVSSFSIRSVFLSFCILFICAFAHFFYCYYRFICLLARSFVILLPYLFYSKHLSRRMAMTAKGIDR